MSSINLIIRSWFRVLALVAALLPCASVDHVFATELNEQFAALERPQREEVIGHRQSCRERRKIGLWLEVEGRYQPFRSREELAELENFLSQNCFTDIYTQIYRGGRAWFLSSLADDSPYWRARKLGFDPLREVITMARRRGIRVHAWINVLSLSTNEAAPILKRHGDRVLLHDQDGRSVAEYFRRPEGSNLPQLDTPALWLDPAAAEVRQELAIIAQEIVEQYSVDGIHLDMARFPYTVRVNSAQTQTPFGFDNNQRRAETTAVVRTIAEAARAVRPNVEISAAVLAPYSRAYDYAFQPWARWAHEGVIDVAIPMIYERQDAVAQAYAEESLRLVSRDRLRIGVGAWLKFEDVGGFEKQLQTLNDLDVGAVLFSYSNLASPEAATLRAIGLARL